MSLVDALQICLKDVYKWKNGMDAREPIARFLKLYSIYISDYASKEDKFFNKILDLLHNYLQTAL